MPQLKYDVHRSELVGFVPRSARRLLDVGCAGGRYAAEVAAANPDIELWGVEPDADNALAASAVFHRVINGTFPQVADQLAPASFDVVTYNDVLEHLLDPAEAITATAPLLSEQGAIIASIPNVRHRSVTWPLISRARWDYDETGILDRTHLRFFTRPTMEALFVDLGWTVQSIRGVNARWHWSEDRERRLVRWLRRITRGRFDDFFFVQYVVTATPPRGSMSD